MRWPFHNILVLTDYFHFAQMKRDGRAIEKWFIVCYRICKSIVLCNMIANDIVSCAVIFQFEQIDLLSRKAELTSCDFYSFTARVSNGDIVTTKAVCSKSKHSIVLFMVVICLRGEEGGGGELKQFPHLHNYVNGY